MAGFLGLNDGAQFRHDLIVRDAGPGIGQGGRYLRTEPCVIGLGFLGSRELGLDRGEFGHAGENTIDVSIFLGEQNWFSMAASSIQPNLSAVSVFNSVFKRGNKFIHQLVRKLGICLNGVDY